ncbi:MAG: GIY-YIG nuclease family protein [Pseudomonadota bacterium]
MTFCIYAIINPIDHTPFYIGETSNFARRKGQHLKGTDQISGLIVRQIKANGFVPLFSILEEHDDEETALRAEIFWIETMLGRGIELVNSQAFTGWIDRKAKRNVETGKLNRMTKLRQVANGRTAVRTRPRPDPVGEDGWSKSDARRLLGMQRNGIEIGGMAKILGRPVEEIRDKLSREWTP